jgi:hypothetical protein
MTTATIELNGTAASDTETIPSTDLLALDALLGELNTSIETAGGDNLTALTFRRNALNRVVGALRSVAHPTSEPAQTAEPDHGPDEHGVSRVTCRSDKRGAKGGELRLARHHWRSGVAGGIWR